MPLAPGSSPAVLEANIAKLIAEGYSVEQAVAIAHAQAGDVLPETGAACGVPAEPSPEESGRYLTVKIKVPLGGRAC